MGILMPRRLAVAAVVTIGICSAWAQAQDGADYDTNYENEVAAGSIEYGDVEEKEKAPAELLAEIDPVRVRGFAVTGGDASGAGPAVVPGRGPVPGSGAAMSLLPQLAFVFQRDGGEDGQGGEAGRRTEQQARLQQGLGGQRPQFVRVPGGQRDHHVAREVLLHDLQGLWLGMCRAVFTGFHAGVAADHHEGLVGLARRAAAQGLHADAVGLGADRVQRRYEGAVGRADRDLVAHGGDSGADAAHRVLGDAAGGEQPGFRIVGWVPESAAHALGDAGDIGRAVQVGGRGKYRTPGQQVDFVLSL